MTAPTNTVTSATNIGIREDLEGVIYRVAAEDVPFQSNIGSAKATNTLHEWQIESLAASDETNAALEGDDISTLTSPNLTTRVGNYAQIFRKTGGVARTQEVVNLAGRDSELDRQKVLHGLELKRDMEKRFMGNWASNAESGGTPRHTGGAVAWCTSNVSRGTGGASGGFGSGVVAAATNGTQRAFTETLLKGVLATAFSNGAKINQAYLGPTHKQQASAFTGIANIRVDAPKTGQAKIVAAADLYTSDFGDIAFIPHPYGLQEASAGSPRNVLLVDPSKAAIATLDGVKSLPLAKSGDSEKFLLTAEKAFVARNEKAMGVVADLL